MPKSSTINYQIAGAGKPLLLIHGWSMHSGVWADFVQEFAAEYKIITLDLRGHGKSKSMGGPYNFPIFAEDIVNLLQTLDLKEVTCIGWSMGVSIILQLFEGTKGLIDSLVFISGNPSLTAKKDYEFGTPEVTVTKLIRKLERNHPAGLKKFYGLLFTPQELAAFKNSKGYCAVTDINAGASRQAALEALKWSQHGDLRSVLPTIDVPTLIVHGSNDTVCVPEAALFMHAWISGSQLLMLDGAGHVPFITRQSEVHRAIKDFLVRL